MQLKKAQQFEGAKVIISASVAEGLGDRFTEYTLGFKPGSWISFLTRKIGYRSGESIDMLIYESLWWVSTRQARQAQRKWPCWHRGKILPCTRLTAIGLVLPKATCALACAGVCFRWLVLAFAGILLVCGVVWWHMLECVGEWWREVVYGGNGVCWCAGVCRRGLACVDVCWHVVGCAYMYWHVVACAYMYWHVRVIPQMPQLSQIRRQIRGEPRNDGPMLRSTGDACKSDEEGIQIWEMWMGRNCSIEVFWASIGEKFAFQQNGRTV